MPRNNQENDRRNNNDQINWASKFDTSWLTEGITKDTVEFAKIFGRILKQGRLSTSQIRNIYGELKRIEMKGFEKEKTSFLLLKPKMAYANSRQKSNGLQDFKNVFDKAYENIKDEKSFLNFMQIMEAILAYHKSFGGK